MQSFASASCARIPRILGVTKQVRRELLDARSMALAERLEGPRIAVLCSSHQNRIAQPRIDEWPFRAEGLLDLTPAARGSCIVCALV